MSLVEVPKEPTFITEHTRDRLLAELNLPNGSDTFRPSRDPLNHPFYKSLMLVESEIGYITQRYPEARRPFEDSLNSAIKANRTMFGPQEQQQTEHSVNGIIMGAAVVLRAFRYEDPNFLDKYGTQSPQDILQSFASNDDSIGSTSLLHRARRAVRLPMHQVYLREPVERLAACQGYNISIIDGAAIMHHSIKNLWPKLNPEPLQISESEA